MASSATLQRWSGRPGMLMLWQRGWLATALLLQAHWRWSPGAWIGADAAQPLAGALATRKKLLGFVSDMEERVRCSRITFLSSRSNTICPFPAVPHGGGSHGLHLF